MEAIACRSVAAALAVVLAVGHVGPAAAQSCTQVADQSATRGQLFDILKAAPNESSGLKATNDIWAFWTKAPDATAQDMLDRGMAAIRYGDFAESEAILDELVLYCPSFAEGWNQRAFARFLSNRLDASLEDIDRTLELEPLHFGALSGQARIFFKRGLPALARVSLTKAVRANPWLAERHMLNDGTGKTL